MSLYPTIDYSQKLENGYAYINFEEPTIAYNTLGRSIVSPSYIERSQLYQSRGKIKERYFSFFFYKTIAGSGQTYKRLCFELELEKERKQFFPGKASRLQGLYFFSRLDDAHRAEMNWGGTFNEDFLFKIQYPDSPTVVDSNWITFYGKESYPPDWKKLYWSSVPLQGRVPIWESITDKFLVIADDELKYKSLETLQYIFPEEQLGLLEDQRLRNEHGDALSGMFYIGIQKGSKYEISPSMIIIHINGKRPSKDSFFPLVDGTPDLVVPKGKSNIISLADFRDDKVILENGSKIMRLLEM